MKKLAIILILGIIIAVGIGYAASVGSPTENTVSEIYPDDTDSLNLPLSPSQAGTASAVDTSPDAAGGEYVDYSDSLVDQMLADGKRVVLFFHAAWCPTCRLADRRIREATYQIPSDVVIVKVDYDREKSLVDAYGVLYQHTFVQISEDRSPVTKFQGSSTLPAILANIQ